MKCKSAATAKKQADKHFSLAIREQAGWKCEACGVFIPPPTQQLQNSHYYSRVHSSSRFLVLNCFSQCAPCHAWYESRRPDFNDFFISKRGRGNYEKLKWLHHQIVRFRKTDFESIAEHFKNEHERISNLRLCGHDGWIKLNEWPGYAEYVE